MPNESSSEKQALSAALSAGSGCPPLQQLEQLLANPAIDPDLSRHVKTCLHCATELGLLRDFHLGTLRESEMEPVLTISERLRARSAVIATPSTQTPAREPRWKGFWTMRWLAPVALSAAGILIFIAVGVQWRQSAPALHKPGGPAQEVLRSGSVVVLAPAGDVSQVPALLQWQPVASAVKYQVHMFEVDQSPVWSAETTQDRIDLPSHIRALIVPHKTLLWQVSAVDASGRVVGESNSVGFRLLQNLYNR